MRGLAAKSVMYKLIQRSRKYRFCSNGPNSAAAQ